MAKVLSGAEFSRKVFAVNRAFADSGTVVEKTGRNDGEQLDKVNAVFGNRGGPYCVTGAYWAFAKAYCDACKVPYTAGSAARVFASVMSRIQADWGVKWSASCTQMLVDNASTVKRYRGLGPMPGVQHADYLVFEFAPGERHFEQFDKADPADPSFMYTVGWNTTSNGAVGGNSNDPGSGGGCYYKRRPFGHHVIACIGWWEGK